MLLYVISLRDTAEENKTFSKLYAMLFFLNVKMHSILKHSIILHDIHEHRYSQKHRCTFVSEPRNYG